MAKTPITELLARNLREYMNAGELSTQAALGKKSGVDQKTISNMLNPKNRAEGTTGKLPSATLAAVEKVADALGVGVWELLSPLSRAQKDFYRGVMGMVRETTTWPVPDQPHSPTVIRGEGKDLKAKPPTKRRRKPGEPQ